MLKNPFTVYILAFGSVLCIYQLGWSDLYQDITLDTLLFFALTSAVAASLALAVHDDIGRTRDYHPGKLPKFTWVLVAACLSADILHNGSIPLLDLLRGDFVYGSFTGIKSLHVFTVTFGGAFATIRFADFLYATGKRRWVYLYEAIIVIAYYVLVVSRGAALITLTSCAFVYVIKRGGVGIKRSVLISILALAVLYANGVIGEMRSPSADLAVMPSKSFRDSEIPRSYYWTYLYATVPLANLQLAVSGVGQHEYDASTAGVFLVSEILPDFISKRILTLIGSERISTQEIAPGFNVATIFGRAYAYFGWVGALFMFIALMTFSIFYLAMMLESSYCVPALALLNTLVAFSIFDNMVAFSGMSLQLAWPLVLSFLSGRQDLVSLNHA